jgi:monolysocardiolipin acyltransferase
MPGPKTALLKGMAKEVLRTLKDDSAYLAQADQLASTSSAVAAWGSQPDAHRAFARLQQALAAGGDAASLWRAGKLRAKARLRQAYAAVERRYEEAVGAGGGAADEPLQASALATDPQAALLGQQQQHGMDERELQELYGRDDWARAAVMYTLANLGRTWMTQLNTTEVEGAEHLAAAMRREPGRPLVTVSNHVAAIDDPFVMAAVLPPELFAAPEKLRWTLCASDRCFHRAALVPFFRAAKVLPVERGAGMFQPGLAAAEARLRAGDWVHIFPEGTRSRDGARIGPARKGVGRLVAACAGGGAAGAAAPLVVPFVHAGMQDVMPRGALVPRAGKRVRVLVGEPVEVADLLAAASREGWADDDLYKRIAARVGLALQSLRARLDGAPLDGAALRALEAEQAGASGLDLYDPRDRHANRVGWRAAGAARWVHSLRDRVDFKSWHRDFAVRGVAAAALERVAGGSSGGAAADGGGSSWSSRLPPATVAYFRNGLAGGSSGSPGSSSAGGGSSGHATSSPTPGASWAAATALHGCAA